MQFRLLIRAAAKLDNQTNSLQVILFLIFVIYIIYLYSFFGTEFGRWDIMPLTTWPFFVVAVQLSNSFQRRIREAFLSLESHGSLILRTRKLDVLLRYLRRRALLYGGVFSLVVVGFNAIALVLSGELDFDFSLGWYQEFEIHGQYVLQDLTVAQVAFERLMLPLVLFVAGLVAGLKLGQAVAYGTAISQLPRMGAEIRLAPGHPDKASGLKPIGQFISFQAMVATLPAFWLAVWILVIPLGTNYGLFVDYSHWLSGFISTLSLAIFISLLAFGLPINSMNKRMLRMRGAMLEASRPKLMQEIQKQYAAAASHDNRGELILAPNFDDLTELQKRLYTLETTPVWPLDPAGIVRFIVIVFATFFIPLIQAYEEYAKQEGALQFFFIMFNALKSLLDLF